MVASVVEIAFVVVASAGAAIDLAAVALYLDSLDGKAAAAAEIWLGLFGKVEMTPALDSFGPSRLVGRDSELQRPVASD